MSRSNLKKNISHIHFYNYYGLFISHVNYAPNVLQAKEINATDKMSSTFHYNLAPLKVLKYGTSNLTIRMDS